MKWPTATIAALVVFNVITCGGPIEEEDFPAVFADNYCSRAKKCDPDYDELFTDMDDCVDTTEAWIETWIGLQGIFCDFDPDGARTCVQAVNEGNCADFLDRNDEDDLECNTCG